MIDYKTGRDEAAEAYGKKDIENNPNGYHISDYCNDWVLPGAFEAGADWATAYWLEQVRVLTEALEKIDCPQLNDEGRPISDADALDEIGKIARNALAKWSELTKPSEGDL